MPLRRPDHLRLLSYVFAVFLTFAGLENVFGDSTARPLAVQTERDLTAELARLTQALNSGDEEERRDAVLKLTRLAAPQAVPALLSATNDSSEKVRAAAIRGLGILGDTSVAPALAARLAQEKSPFVRKAAAYALGRLGDRGAAAALVEALQDKDAEVVSASAFALGEIADPNSVPALTRLLAHKNDFVRAYAARALGRNQAAAIGAAPLLIKVLDSDNDQEVRRQAAIALGLIGATSALPSLERARRTPDPYLRRAAAADSIARIQKPRP